MQDWFLSMLGIAYSVWIWADVEFWSSGYPFCMDDDVPMQKFAKLMGAEWKPKS